MFPPPAPTLRRAGKRRVLEPVASLPAADRDGEGAKTRSEWSHDGETNVAPACPTGSQAGREYGVFLLGDSQEYSLNFLSPVVTLQLVQITSSM